MKHKLTARTNVVDLKVKFGCALYGKISNNDSADDRYVPETTTTAKVSRTELILQKYHRRDLS